MGKKVDLLHTVSSLGSKVEKLIQIHDKLKEDHDKLCVENEMLTQKAEEQKKELDKLHDKLKVIKLAKTLNGDEQSNTELKYKINELIREIDKSIAQLSS